MITPNQAGEWLDFFKRMSKEQKQNASWKTFVAIFLIYNAIVSTNIFPVFRAVSELPKMIEIQERQTKQIEENTREIKEIKTVLSKHGLASDLKKKETVAALYD